MTPTARLLLALPLGCLFACAAPLKEEPAAGMLKPGDVVHVEDGSCPPGQVRRVAVGPAPADRTQPSPRASTCVPQ